MKHIIGKIAICFSGLFFYEIYAASVKMEIGDIKGNVIENVIVGIPFQLRFIIKGHNANVIPHIACPANLVLKLSGKEIHSINGSITTIYNYTAIASAEQKYTVGPGTVTINGSIIQTDPIVFEASVDQEANKSPIKNNISKPFIECTVQKSSVFIGEIISCTFRFYCPSHINHIVLKQIQAPKSEHYLINQKGTPKEGIELINQKPFKYIEWEFDIQFLKEGDTFLSPFHAEYTIEEDDNNGLFGGLSIFFQHHQVRHVQSNTIQINVKPIPDYKGKNVVAIGNFTDFVASITPTAIAINDGAVFSLRLTGVGNVSMINHPRLTNIPPSIQVYESQSKIESNIQTNEKTKAFDYIMQVEEPGLIKIPPQKLIFFDPITEKHVVIKTNEIEFDVKPHNEKSTQIDENQSTKNINAKATTFHAGDQNSTNNDNVIPFINEEGSSPWLIHFTYKQAIFFLLLLFCLTLVYLCIVLLIPLVYAIIHYRCAYLIACITLKKLEKKNKTGSIIKVFKQYVKARRFNCNEPDYNSFLSIICTVLKNQKDQDAWRQFYADLTEAAYGSLCELNIKNNIWQQAYYWLHLLKKKGM